MDYNQIKNYLEKFKKIIFQKEETNKIISNIIFKHTSFFIESNLIKIKNGIIFIESSPIINSEILINKRKILNDLKKEIPNINFINIKY